MQLSHFTKNCRFQNLDDFERDDADTYLRRAGLLNLKEKGMNIRYIMNRCLVNAFERRESKCCAVLMKYCRKVKVERVITFQMAQQLKTKTINVVPGQLFCRQCKARFFLETDSMH